MEQAGTDIAAARQELARAFNGSRAGMDAFTRAYEQARQENDIIFGRKFHPGFPRVIKSCDSDGCGYYPSTVAGAYNEGIDVVVSPLTSVPSPLSAHVQLFNVSLLPVSMQGLYSSTRYDNAILVTPAESSYNGVQFILSNLTPLPSVGRESVFISGGTAIATATNVHIELIKTIDGRGFRLDPTSFLQPHLELTVSTQLQCNDIVTSVGGAVVDRRTFMTDPVSRQLIGSSLTDVPGHEFPQPFDFISLANVSIQPPSQVTFFQSSTFLMVGQIPVQFEFSGVGVYSVGVSLMSGILSGHSAITSNPTFSASTRGSVRVGSTTYADVSLQGTLLETELPLTISQNFASTSSPLQASSSMDIVLVPSTVNLTTELVRRQIGGSGLSGATSSEILENSVVWSYSIPPLRRDEFYYEGIFRDTTPPTFTPLSLADCSVRQLPGRDYGNPAFELLVLAADPEGRPELQIGVGTSSGFDDVLPFRVFHGDLLTLYQPLQPAVELFFTVIAANRDGVQSRANCGFPRGHFYDRSPPQARITPIRSVSSHPSQIQVLLSLFDEYGLEDMQEVAVGTVPGSQGTQIQTWMPFNASLIQTPPADTGAVLDQFSFARFGRLVTGYLNVIYGTSNASSCGRSCLSLSDCRSFDYSLTDQICILHKDIEGPNSISGQDNAFSTPSLQTARGYEHYERLGVGNSTQLLLSGLSLSHGVMYHVNLRLRNRLGYQSVVSSPGFLVDFTAPEPVLIGPPASIIMATHDVYPQGCQSANVSLPGCIDAVYQRSLDVLYRDGASSGSVFNGPTYLTDSRFTPSTSILSANWNPFLDPESNIYSYTWCIGTSIGLCDVLPFTDPHLANGIVSQAAWTLAGVATDLNLSEGAYYVTVRATNDIAYGGPLFTTVYHSTPYMVDTTPPVVSDSVDVSYNGSTNQLSVNYTVSDGLGQLSMVELALGRSELDTSVLGWQLLSASPQPGPNEDVITVLVPDGLPVWLKLRVTDAAGLRAIFAAEEFFTVDRTPPLVGRVGDGPSPGIDVAFVGADRTYCVNWAGFSDPESGLGPITWTIVRASGNVVVGSRNLTQSERLVGVACETLASLTHNMTYYSTLTVSNAAMETLTVTASTNGVLFDQTAPEASGGGVVSFTHGSSPFIGSSSSLAVSWLSFVDYESGISRHDVRVRVNGQVAYSQSLGGTDLEFRGNIFQFSSSDTVVVEVEGVNGAGGSVVIQSRTITVDLTPPEISAISDGSVLSNDLDYQNNGSSLSITWSARDDISSIAAISAVVYEVRGGRRTRFYPPLPDEGVSLPIDQTTATISGLQLTSGTQYHVSVTFTNGAGLSATYETDGVIVDLTPPIVHSVEVLNRAYMDVVDTVSVASDAVVIVTNPNLTEVRWIGVDSESGIDRYLVGVVDSNGTQVLPVEEEFAGSSEGGTLMLPPGMPEDSYTVYVTAISRAQTASTPSLSSSFRISSGAGAGVVLDGPAGAAMAMTFDLDYTDEVTSVTARFHGFASEGCPGGVARYEWAVHTGDSPPAVVLEFTTAGIFENENDLGSGHAQLPVPGLERWSNRRLYTTVRAVMGCGRVSQATSDGFIVDLSPPTLQVQVSGSDQISSASDGGVLYMGSTGYSTRWQASDSESGVPGDAQVSVGTYPGGRDLAGPLPLSSDYLRGTVNSPEGVPTYVSVTVTNGVGVESEEVSEPITLDTSPPEMGELNCIILSYPLPLVGVADNISLINSTSGRVVCRWSNIEDSQSTLLRFTIAIGTSLTDQSVLGVTALPADQRSYTSPVFPSLVPSTPYYVVLTATNRAGLERISTSGALYLDATPPVLQERLLVYPNFKMADYLSGRLANVTLVGGALEDTVCLLETDVISVIFGVPSDSESSSARTDFTYEIGIGYGAGNDDFQRFSRIFPIPLPSGHPLSNLLSTQLYYRLSRLELASAGRRPLFFTIKVNNAAGLYSLLASGPVYIKSNSTAQLSWIRDGVSSDSDIEYQSSTVEIGARFSLSVNCPVRRGRWAVESVDGNLTHAYTDLALTLPGYPGAEFLLRIDRVLLFNEETYRILVQVTDWTGEVHVLRSDGVTVTTRAVKPGRVTDGPVPSQDLNYQESLTSLRACWSGFGDGSPEQMIDYYEVAAGNSPSLPHTRSSVAPYVNVGRNVCQVFEDLVLVPEAVEYFVTVRAYTVSGAFVEAYSNGVRAGLRHAILPGNITLPRFQSDTTSLSARWSGFQSNLPIRRYEWALGSTLHENQKLTEFCSDSNASFSSDFDVSAFTSVGLDSTVRIANLALEDNVTYYLTLRVVDQAKNCIATTTPEGVIIDVTSPTLDASSTSVLVGPRESRQPGLDFVIYVTGEEELMVEWEEFSDPESGIGSYSVGVYPQAACGNNSWNAWVALFGPVDFGLATTADIGRLQLQPGVPYVAVVTATNSAGVSTRAYSQPILVDDSIPVRGTVKDGLNWESDLQYQSDLATLSAVFSYAMQPPSPESVVENGPCPNDLYYDLINYSPEWSNVNATLAGFSSSATVFSDSQVSVSANPPGIAVSVFRDQTNPQEEVLSGVYQTRVDLRHGGMFQADIRSSRGFPTVQEITVTSVVFVGSGNDSNIVPKFEPSSSSYNFEADGNFSAFGLQIYDNFTNSTHSLLPRAILWARDPSRLGQVLFLEREMPQLDLSITNTYRLDFETQQTDSYITRTAKLYINAAHIMTLYGLPHLTSSTRVVFTSFNQRGLIPPAPTMANAQLSSVAVFGNVSLPSPMAGDLCDYGIPFHSRSSPVVQFRVGVGTRPGVTDIQPLQLVATNCLSCLPGPCSMYACNPSCRDDPYLFNVTLGNLTLSPGYGSQLDLSVNDSVISPFSSWFQPATYHVVVEATTASARVFIGSSNGVVIDTTPPVLAFPVVNYDYSFSRSQPVRFQGNNATIAASWRFRDDQSFVMDYSWAIGTAPFSSDIQGYVSVGVSTEGVATSLSLVHNTTYYVTVVATNGAGLTATSTSAGVTYIATELNVTLLSVLVDVEFVRLVTFTNQDGVVENVRVTDDDSRAGVTWVGVSSDIEDLNWRIGSSPGAEDILPPVPISLLDPTLPPRSRLTSGILYHGDQVLTEVSEIIALYEGKEVDPLDNNLSLQPGSLLYQSIEFCNFVHVCTVSMGTPSIVIRRKDVEARVLFAGAPTRLLVTQTAPGGVNINTVHTLDRTYLLQLFTQTGLRVGSSLYAGFLDQSDVMKTYRSMTPYISNPFLTMSQTSREVARRFTEFGGPSFYVSFLGQDSLDAPLELNVTFDSLLDWDIATPELAYWDTGASVWRQVSETCGNSSTVDLRTFTIAVQVCYTVLDMTTPSSRRRRQADMSTPSSMAVASFLERPVQFIVMRVGNVSSNTPPQLQLSSDPIQVTEDTTYSTDLQYVDAESDVVDFSLDSVPNLGNVTLLSTGMLTYTPCRHCTGTDTIQISIRERPIGENHIPLMSSGQIVFQVVNVNDAPKLYVYQDGIVGGASSGEVSQAGTATGFIEANRTSGAPVVTVAAVDVDGSQDSLTLVVLEDGQFGSVSFRTRLDAVGTFESFPISLPVDAANLDLATFRGEVTFLSSYLTYLPSDPSFVGNDTFRIAVRDSRAVLSSRTLTVSVEVLPSPCLNDGTCAGSQTDPLCTDIAARRGGADDYNCTCPVGFTGATCEVSVTAAIPTPTRGCPPGIPVVQCEGDPCQGAECPSHPGAECRVNYCGSCKAEWYVGSDRVTCHADDTSTICRETISPADQATIVTCFTAQCECPSQPYSCPDDSILVKTRVDDCCVRFDCVCPNTSCPLLMECGQGVRPVPRYRGNRFPGRCCPEYNYEDINECSRPSENLCENTCVNEDRTYSCSCPTGRTLASDGLHCGVCAYNDSQYLLGDRVQIGCNWCQCSSDTLNGERWQCTSSTCEDGCFSNGVLYPLGSAVSIGELQCVCSLTGRNSQDWMCSG